MNRVIRFSRFFSASLSFKGQKTRALSAFGAMRGGAAEFVLIVVDRARKISAALFASDAAALSPLGSQ